MIFNQADGPVSLYDLLRKIVVSGHKIDEKMTKCLSACLSVSGTAYTVDSTTDLCSYTLFSLKITKILILSAVVVGVAVMF